MTVNKSDIINLVSDKNSLSLADTEYSIKKIIDYMGVNLYQGDRIEIRGFGSFCLHTHKSRIARNAKTGDKIAFESSNTVHFIPSNEL
jgi:integration host factor subunit beta